MKLNLCPAVRSYYYSQAFGGELGLHAPGSGSVTDTGFGHSTLWRSTVQSGSAQARYLPDLKAIPAVVGWTLKNSGLLTPDNDASAPAEEWPIERLSKVVGGIFRLWDIGRIRQGMDPLFRNSSERLGRAAFGHEKEPISTDTQSLIAVVSDEAVKSLPLLDISRKERAVYDRPPIEWHASDRLDKLLIMALANRGPRFIERWMNGDIIGDYLTQRFDDEETVRSWLGDLGPSARKSILSKNIKDPHSALARFVNNVLSLNNEALADRFGMSPAEVGALVSASDRRAIAIGHPKDPVGFAEQAIEGFRGALGYENIATVMGCTPEEAELLLSPSARWRMAISNINPQGALERYSGNVQAIFELIRSLAEVERGYFTTGVISQIARNYPGKVEQATRTYLDNMKLLTTEHITNLLNLPPEESGEVEQHFTRSLRERVALGFMNSVDSTLEAIGRNLGKISYKKMAVEFFGGDVSRAQETITVSMRYTFAVNNINNPMEAVREYLAGEKMYGGKYYDSTAGNTGEA